VTRYDRVIPPGGKGNVTLAVDSRGLLGEFQKEAVVWSDDPVNRNLSLYMAGLIKPHIFLDPGSYIALVGKKGHVPREYLRIENNHTSPFKITGVESDLGDRIGWLLRELRPGYAYILEVEDLSKTPGDYTGHLFLRTDNTKKPELVIIINGRVEGE
jgi:hypothetical protein